MRPELLLSALAGLIVAACGGGSTGPGPGTPQPPPPPPPPAVRLDLQAGERIVLTDAGEMAAFAIAGAGEAREYQVILMSASEVEGGSAPVRLVAQPVASSANMVPSTASLSTGSAPRRASQLLAGLDERRQRSMRPGHLARLQRARDEIRRIRPRASSSIAASSSPARTSIPVVGETITLNSANTPGGGISCTAIKPVDGVVRAVGQTFVLLEDVAVAGHLTAQDYAELETELDAFIAPVDQAYFGSPPDLDGNGRVIVFFTAEVNLAGDAIGWFSPLDMFPPADCPASNEGEILWLIGPDPDGSESEDDYTAQEVKEIARGLVAHEFQHLINNFQRFLGGAGGSDDIWIEEGLSHIAEEVSGFYRLGLETRAGLGYTEVGIGQLQGPAFRDFYDSNMNNAQVYLGSPETTPALATFDDPESTFAMRGWGFMFLRWLADRYAPATPEGIVGGSGEHLLFREITTGGPAHMTGIPGLLRAITEASGETMTWEQLLAEYFAAPAVVDAVSSPSGIPFLTWDLQRFFDEAMANSLPELGSGYPLRPTEIDMGSSAGRNIPFEVGASAARYFRFAAAGAHGDMRVEFTNPSGAPIPNGASASVIVVRTR